MNKKGFTLIELLASIALMAIITIIASINIINIFKQKDKTNTEGKNNIITTAACLYIELESQKDLKEKCLSQGCEISTSRLINAGILNSKDVDKEKVINIYSENNEKKCIIKQKETN